MFNLEQMTQGMIKAMGFNPDEFKALVSDAMTAMVEMNDAQKAIEKRLDRIEKILDSEPVMVTNVQVTDESQKEASDAN